MLDEPSNIMVLTLLGLTLDARTSNHQNSSNHQATDAGDTKPEHGRIEDVLVRQQNAVGVLIDVVQGATGTELQGRVQRIVIAIVDIGGVDPRQGQTKQGPVEVLGEQDEASRVGNVDERVHGDELQLIEQLPSSLRTLVSPPAALDERQNLVLWNYVVVVTAQISSCSSVPLEH